MARTPKWATEPLRQVLPALLTERDMSLRALAKKLGIGHSYLSRAVRRADDKVASGELAARIALALDLPEDYFAEYRAAYVAQRLDESDLRDDFYKRLVERDEPQQKPT